MNNWWVNHKQTFTSEIDGGYIWSPKRNTNNSFNQSYENMTFTRPGDLIFSYADAQIKAVGVIKSPHIESPKPNEFENIGDNWGNIGWKVAVDWVKLRKPIQPKNSIEEIAPLLPEKYSPIRKNGKGNQVCYLANISDELAQLLIRIIAQNGNDIITSINNISPSTDMHSWTGDKIPDGITSSHIERAILRIDSGEEHKFAQSREFDVLYNGRRYPPKAIIGVAAEEILGFQLGPRDFKGGLGSKCFRILKNNDFQIVTKANHDPFPDEITTDKHTEGSVSKVTVNKYERDPKARKKCIDHYGSSCTICGFDFSDKYGELGDGFIHVHHLTPLSEIKGTYKVDPIKDLRPVCPNCHAMIHKRRPPFSIQEIIDITN